jgi:PhzF family phenazine biosynthesis protein
MRALAGSTMSGCAQSTNEAIFYVAVAVTIEPMRNVRYLQLDVFAASRGGGNPLGVVFDAEAWSDVDMQAFAAWTGLVETTFVLPPTQHGASYRLRIFTPVREIAFAGHPSIGSAHAVLEIGMASAQNGTLVQECAAGLLTVRIDGEGSQRQLFVEAPRARILDHGLASQPLLQTVLGTIRLGVLPPALVEGGRRWWLAEFDSEADLRAWQPDHAAIAALAKASDNLGLCVFARSQESERQLVVRAFPCGVGINEDPASGAANGLIAAYIGAREPQGKLAQGYRVSQGREIGHDARIMIRMQSGENVWVGGRTDTVISGSASWPLST